MTKNQERFVAEYIVDRNATRAYRAAYPGAKSESAIRANASRLIAKDNIRAAIEAAQLEAVTAAGIRADDVLREVAGIAYAPTDRAASVRDKLLALQLLGRYLRLWDGQEESHDINVIFTDLDGAAD